jgi:hypothetical protein
MAAHRTRAGGHRRGPCEHSSARDHRPMVQTVSVF